MRIFIAALAILALSGGMARAKPGEGELSVRLRMQGPDEATTNLRSCLETQLGQLPDTVVAAGPIGDTAKRPDFILDVVSEAAAPDRISASFVVLSTFPEKEFKPLLAKGDKILVARLSYYTLVRQHELVTDRPPDIACKMIVDEFRRASLEKAFREIAD